MLSLLQHKYVYIVNVYILNLVYCSSELSTKCTDSLLQNNIFTYLLTYLASSSLCILPSCMSAITVWKQKHPSFFSAFVKRGWLLLLRLIAALHSRWNCWSDMTRQVQIVISHYLPHLSTMQLLGLFESRIDREDNLNKCYVSPFPPKLWRK